MNLQWRHGCADAGMAVSGAFFNLSGVAYDTP